jgi:Uncharacterised nucleotidyltransferase
VVRTTRLVRRARSLATLTGVLRGDTGVALPTDSGDWSAFLELASAHGLLPAVWVALRDAERVDMTAPVAVALEQASPGGRAVPEVVMRRAYDRNAARTARLVGAGVDILERLAAAGIPSLPLKGLHTLLTGAWPDPAARTMVDLDVLVPGEVAARAFALLRAVGFEEHPDPIGEHADHHLPMLRAGEVTVELHTALLVSRWNPLAPARGVFERAAERPTGHGRFLLADDTDTFVHLVAHAQLQEDTYRLLGLPLRPLLETTHLLGTAIDWRDVGDRFARAGAGHVLAAHLDAVSRLYGVPRGSRPTPARAGAHTRLAEGGVAVPAAVAAWTYLARLPHSFAEARMADEFGPGTGPAWLWRARARHAARRVSVRVGRRGH